MSLARGVSLGWSMNKVLSRGSGTQVGWPAAADKPQILDSAATPLPPSG